MAEDSAWPDTGVADTLECTDPFLRRQQLVLRRKVNAIKKHLPNLRCISMSPWVDVEAGAAAVGKDLVFAYKPNPAMMAGDTWDTSRVRTDLRSVLEKTRGCNVAVLMKDLHTCNGHSDRMSQWTSMAVELAEEFAC